MPELIFITGCNAAGKSTFIRTRLNELEGFEILMTDVYKSRTKELALKAIADKKDIVLETVFNDSSFINIVEAARKVLYLSGFSYFVNKSTFTDVVLCLHPILT
ncbi:hypothetical protein WAE58_01710 [Pedobacter panaciterrae]|uniref:UDP-N-acetylglucosamine kinase n=1 Tax=Pedobacter panaciterrae TaxID=363849 RepID=A0ABU8NGY0_9SPHI